MNVITQEIQQRAERVAAEWRASMAPSPAERAAPRTVLAIALLLALQAVPFLLVMLLGGDL